MMELMAGKLLLPATDLDAGGLRTRMDQLERKFAAGSVVHAPMAASAAERSIEPDAPSPDDADIDDATGVELILRELGGTQIGEIEH